MADLILNVSAPNATSVFAELGRMLDTLKSNVSRVSEELKGLGSSVPKVPTSLFDSFKAGAFDAASAVNSISYSIKGLASDGAKAGKAAGDGIKDALKSAAPETTKVAENIGQNISQNVAAGIKSSEGSVKSAAKGLRDVVAQVTEALDAPVVKTRASTSAINFGNGIKVSSSISGADPESLALLRLTHEAHKEMASDLLAESNAHKQHIEALNAKIALINQEHKVITALGERQLQVDRAFQDAAAKQTALAEAKAQAQIAAQERVNRVTQESLDREYVERYNLGASELERIVRVQQAEEGLAARRLALADSVAQAQIAAQERVNKVLQDSAAKQAALADSKLNTDKLLQDSAAKHAAMVSTNANVPADARAKVDRVLQDSVAKQVSLENSVANLRVETQSRVDKVLQDSAAKQATLAESNVKVQKDAQDKVDKILQDSAAKRVALEESASKEIAALQARVADIKKASSLRQEGVSDFESRAKIAIDAQLQIDRAVQASYARQTAILEASTKVQEDAYYQVASVAQSTSAKQIALAEAVAKEQIASRLKVDSILQESAAKQEALAERSAQVQIGAQDKINKALQESAAKQAALAAEQIETQLQVNRVFDAASAKREAQLLKEAEAASIRNAAYRTSSLTSQFNTASTIAQARSLGVSEETLISKYGSDAVAASKNLAALKAALDATSNAQLGTANSSKALGSSLLGLESQARNAHSAFRGLASGFDAMWLSWGNIVPLVAGAAISHSIAELVKNGSELEYQLTFVAQLSNGAKISVDEFTKAVSGSVIGTKDAAEGLRALAQAGLDSQKALAVLPDVMNLAIVGEMTMSQAALAATGIMHAFNLEIYDMGHVTDVLTKAAASSNTSVTGIVEAMKSASVVADQYHLNLEQVTQALAILGNRNITGSAAGTSLKTMIDDLAAPTKKAADMMKQLGIEVYNSNTGQLKSLKEMLQELSVAFAGLDEKSRNIAIGAIFEKRSAKAVSALMEDLKKYLDGVDTLTNSAEEKVAGFAARVATELSQGVKGSMKTAANDLSLVFDQAFEKTSDSWSNLVAKFDRGVKSDAFKGFVDTVNVATIKLLDNAGAIAGLGVALVAFGPTIELVTTAYKWLKAEAAMAAVAMEGSAVAAASSSAALVEAEAATAALGAAISRIFWPVAIVGTLTAAYFYLKDGIDAAKEAEDRKNRESATTVEKLNEETRRIHEQAEAFRIAARDGIAYADALLKVKGVEGKKKESDLQTAAIEAAQRYQRYVDSHPVKVNSRWDNGIIGASDGPDTEAQRLAKAATDAETALQNHRKRNVEELAAMQKAADAQRVSDQHKGINDLKLESEKLEGVISARRDRALAKGESLGQLDKYRKDVESIQNAISELSSNPSNTKGIEKVKQQLKSLGDELNSTARHVTAAKAEKPKFEVHNSNELASTKKALSEQEGLLKSSYDNQMRLLDEKHKAGLMSDAEYMGTVLDNDAAFIQKHDAIVSEIEDRFLNELGTRYEKIMANKPSPARDAALESLLNEYADFYSHLDALQEKSIGSINKREESVSIAFERENKKVSDHVDKYIRKMQEKTAADAAMQAARRAMQGKPEEEVARFEAETAARSQGKSEINTLAEDYEKAKDNADDFYLRLEEKAKKGLDVSYKEIRALEELEEKYKNLAKNINKVTEANEENAKKAGDNAYLKSVQEQSDKLAKGIRESVAEGLTSAGSDGGKKLRKAIEDALVTKPFQVVLETSLKGLSQNIANVVYGNAGDSSLASISSGVASIGQSTVSLVKRGASNAISGVGDSLGLSKALDSATLAASTFGQSVVQGASLVGSGSMTLTEAMQSGAIAMSKEGGMMAGLGMKIGAAAPYVLAAIAAAKVIQLAGQIGSVIPADSYLHGGYTSDNKYSVGLQQNYEQRDGGVGFLGATHTNSSWSEANPAITQYMSALNDAVKGSIRDLATSVGLSTKEIEGYSKSLVIEITKKDAKEQVQAIDKAFEGYGENMVQDLFGDQLLQFKQLGETASQTLQRVVSDLAAVNNVMRDFGQPLYASTMEGAQGVETLLKSVGGLDKFNELAADLQAANAAAKALSQPLFDVSVEGAKAAKALVDSVGGLEKFKERANNLIGVNQALSAMGMPKLDVSMAGSNIAEELVRNAGGLDKFQSIVGQYYNLAYSAQEKAAKNVKTLTEAFDELGVATPKTMDELRKMVDAQDTSTEAGRKMWMSLMSLAPALDLVTESSDAAREKLQSSADSFVKNLAAANGQSTISALQGTFDRRMSDVTAAVPNITNWAGLSNITREQYIGYSETDRSKLDAAVSAYGELRDAIQAAADKAKSAAKTARDAADSAAKAYEDALKNVKNSLRDASRGLADAGKTDFQKRLAQIAYDAEDTQTELDRLNSEASKLAAKASELELAAASLSIETTDTVTTELIDAAAKLKKDSATVAANVGEALENSVNAFGEALDLVPAISGLFDGILKNLRLIPPALSAVANAASTVGSAASQASGPVGSFAAATAAVGASAATTSVTVSVVASAFSGVSAAASITSAALSGLGAAFAASASALNGLSSAFAAATSALVGLNSAFGSASSGLDSLSTSFGAASASGATLTTSLESVGSAFATVAGAAGAASGSLSALMGSLSFSASAVPSSPQFVGPPTPVAIAKAGGGAIYGPGTATSDSIPAMLSNGEYVIKASSVDKYGTRFLDALNSGTLKPTIYRFTGGSTSEVTDLKDVRTAGAYVDQRLSLLQTLGTPIKTFAEAVSDLAKAGHNFGAGATPESVTKYFVEQLKANPPTVTKTTDKDGKEVTTTTVSAKLMDLVNVLDVNLDPFISGLKERQTWQDKLDVLQNKTTERAQELQKDLAGTTDETTKSLIRQVYAQEDLKDAAKDFGDYQAKLLSARGDIAGAAAAQRSVDLGSTVESVSSAQARIDSGGLTEDQRLLDEYIVKTGNLTIKQYDLNKAREKEVAAISKLTALQGTEAGLNVNLLAAKNNQVGASAAQRGIDLKDTFTDLADAQTRLNTTTDDDIKATLQSTIATDKAIVAQYDRNKALEGEISALGRLQNAKGTYANTTVSWMRANGDDKGADAMQRGIDLKDVFDSTAVATEKLKTATSDGEIASLKATIADNKATEQLYDLNKAREKETEILNRQKSLRESVESSFIEMLKATGFAAEAAALELKNATKDMDDASIATYRLGESYKLVTAAQSGLESTANMALTSEANLKEAKGDKTGAAEIRRAVDIQPYVDAIDYAEEQLKGALSDGEKARLKEAISINEQSIANYDNAKALDVQTEAANKAKQAAEELTNKYKSLLDELTSANIALLRASGKNDQADQMEFDKATNGFDDLHKSMYREVQITKSLTSARERLNQLTASVTASEIELMRARGQNDAADSAQFQADTSGIQIDLNKANAELDKLIVDAKDQLLTFLKEKSPNDYYKVVGENPTEQSLLSDVKKAGGGSMSAFNTWSYSNQIASDTEVEKLKTLIETLQQSLAAASSAFSNKASLRIVNEGNQLQDQIDSLTKTPLELLEKARRLLDPTNVAKFDALQQAKSDAANKSWQEKIDSLIDTERQREIDKARDLAAATDATTQALIKQYYAQLDLNEALDASKKFLESLKDKTSSVEIQLLRAQGKNTEANAVERSHDLKDTYKAAGQAQVMLDYADRSFREFAVGKGVSLSSYLDPNIANQSGASTIDQRKSISTAFEAEAARPRVLSELLGKWATPDANGNMNAWSFSDFAKWNGTKVNLTDAEQSQFSSLNGLTSAKDRKSFSDRYANDVEIKFPQQITKLLSEFASIGISDSQRKSLQGTIDNVSTVEAAYDLNKAREAELKIIGLQDEAMNNYTAAQEKTTQAQKEYANTLKSTIKTLQDFIASLDTAASPTDNLKSARENYRTVAGKAASGDTGAYEKLVPAAKSFLDLSKSYSKTIQDYRRDVAAVRSTINSVINVNQNELSKLPEVASATDATKEAWGKLQKAVMEEANASVMLQALSVDQAESKKRLRTAEETLGDRYMQEVQLLDQKTQVNLESIYNKAVKDKVDTAVLPDYSQTFSLGDLWEEQIAAVMPAKFPSVTNADLKAIFAAAFPGMEPEDILQKLTPEQLTDLINGKIPESLVIETVPEESAYALVDAKTFDSKATETLMLADTYALVDAKTRESWVADTLPQDMVLGLLNGKTLETGPMYQQMSTSALTDLTSSKMQGTKLFEASLTGTDLTKIADDNIEPVDLKKKIDVVDFFAMNKNVQGSIAGVAMADKIGKLTTEDTNNRVSEKITGADMHSFIAGLDIQQMLGIVYNKLGSYSMRDAVGALTYNDFASIVTASIGKANLQDSIGALNTDQLGAQVGSKVSGVDLGGKVPTLTPQQFSDILKSRLDTILPMDFGGAKFDARSMMQSAIDQAVASMKQSSGGTAASASSSTAGSAIKASDVTTPYTQPASGTSGTGVQNQNDPNDPNVGVLLSIINSKSSSIPKVGSLREYTSKVWGDGVYGWPAAAAAYGLLKGYSKNEIYATIRGFGTFAASGNSVIKSAIENYAGMPLPGLAVGTNEVPRDMLAQIHQGEAIIPAAFNPERYAKASGNTALVEEIKALRAEVTRLREEQKAAQNTIAANTRKTAQALTKFDTDGMPETRT